MNCKPGDLAYVVGSSIEEQNGMIVTVERVGRNGMPWWVVSFRGFVITRQGHLANGSAQVPDEYLRPINGVPLDEEISEDMKVPA